MKRTSKEGEDLKKPNLLFIFPDQHRGDWLPYDAATFAGWQTEQPPLRMPHLRSLMDRGVSFTRAVTPSPLCAPARACLAAGLRYEACGVEGNLDSYPSEHRTFYTVLKEQGYSVGGVGKFDLHKPVHWWGLDGWVDELGTLGFTHAIDNAGKIDAINSGAKEPQDPYMKYLYDQGLAELHLKDMNKRKGNLNADETALPEEAYCDNWIANNGLQLLEQFPKEQPWFLMVNFTGPHNPYDITHRMKRDWEQTVFPAPHQAVGDPEITNAVRQNYAAMLENIDRNMGLLLEAVEQRGELEHTIIVYASDHGEMLGDFGYYGKNKPERASIHIPLVFAGPGISKGQHSEALVELQDLASTFVEFAGAEMVEAKDSLSLVPLLLGKGGFDRDVQRSGLQDWRSVNDGRYKLIVSKDNERLYDLAKDLLEDHDLSSKLPEVVERLRHYLKESN
jgi:arylsulfatase